MLQPLAEGNSAQVCLARKVWAPIGRYEIRVPGGEGVVSNSIEWPAFALINDGRLWRPGHCAPEVCVVASDAMHIEQGF